MLLLPALSSALSGLPGTSPSFLFLTNLFTKRISGFELNDGVVSESELQADWITDVVHVPVIHTVTLTVETVEKVEYGAKPGFT